jgi:hypothetical protein
MKMFAASWRICHAVSSPLLILTLIFLTTLACPWPVITKTTRRNTNENFCGILAHLPRCAIAGVCDTSTWLTDGPYHTLGCWQCPSYVSHTYPFDSSPCTIEKFNKQSGKIALRRPIYYTKNYLKETREAGQSNVVKKIYRRRLFS